jgi:hypothetical protein
LLDQVEKRREETVHFFEIRPEWWFVLLLGDEKMNGQKMTARLEGALKSPGIFLSTPDLDGAKESVLEDEVICIARWVTEKISLAKI